MQQPLLASFQELLERHGLPCLARGRVTTVQVNLGPRCNQACRHCHVEAGPARTETMGPETARRLLELLEASSGVEVVDLTGGAPELNPQFRPLVRGARTAGRRVLDRCNLTVLFEPGQEDTPEFLAAHEVDIVASLPCYTAGNVDRQRGSRVFENSIRALERLNRLGYGMPDSRLRLDLVYNPAGAVLPPDQQALEETYRRELETGWGVSFHHLLVLTNAPIGRFRTELERFGELGSYHRLLASSFNPLTLRDVMCRTLVSVDWRGALFDCDFNQVLGLPLAGRPRTVWDLEAFDELDGEAVATAAHCLACTAGSGSSCGGALL